MIQCVVLAVGPLPPYVHLASTDVVHVMNAPRPSPFFTGAPVYYCERKRGRPGNEATLHLSFVNTPASIRQDLKALCESTM